MRTFWPLYLTAFTNFCFTTPLVERRAFENPAVLGWVAAFGVIAIAVVRIWRARRLNELTGFRFEEQDPDVLFQGFKLSEGLAAGPRAN
jgi:hypothetical protein